MVKLPNDDQKISYKNEFRLRYTAVVPHLILGRIYPKRVLVRLGLNPVKTNSCGWEPCSSWISLGLT